MSGGSGMSGESAQLLRKFDQELAAFKKLARITGDRFSWSENHLSIQKLLSHLRPLIGDFSKFPYQSLNPQALLALLDEAIRPDLSPAQAGAGASQKNYGSMLIPKEPEEAEARSQDQIRKMYQAFWSRESVLLVEDHLSLDLLTDPVLLKEKGFKNFISVELPTLLAYQEKGEGPNRCPIISPAPGEEPTPDILLKKLLLLRDDLQIFAEARFFENLAPAPSERPKSSSTPRSATVIYGEQPSSCCPCRCAVM